MLAWENAAEIVDVLVNGAPVGSACRQTRWISPEHAFAGTNLITLRSDQHGGKCPAWPATSLWPPGAVRIEPYARCEVKVSKGVNWMGGLEMLGCFHG